MAHQVNPLRRFVSRIRGTRTHCKDSDDTASPQSPAFHLERIDKDRHCQVRETYHDADPYPGYSKYLDAEHYIGTALHHYDLAGLNPASPESVLDIGTGAGYFPFVCQNLGHPTGCLDLPGNSFYNEMTSLLGVTRIDHKILPLTPLPGLLRRYDVITGFAICFNGHASEQLWGPKEWDFFLNDLASNIASSQARCCFKLNREPSGETLSQPLVELFEKWGAKIDDLVVKISF